MSTTSNPEMGETGFLSTIFKAAGWVAEAIRMPISGITTILNGVSSIPGVDLSGLSTVTGIANGINDGMKSITEDLRAGKCPELFSAFKEAIIGGTDSAADIIPFTDIDTRFVAKARGVFGLN